MNAHEHASVPPCVLGVETSCDETGVALYRGGRVLAERLYSQVALHAEHGGVVPELASRDHLRRLPRLVDGVLADAGVGRSEIAGVAYTAGPGLVGALLVGAALAEGLATALGIPRIGVHHMEGHLLAPMLEDPELAPPFVALLVSGGHTQLVDVAGLGRYRTIGNTLDDAAGEAFDKTATLLGLGYPGGAALERLAADGDPERFAFTRPMINRQGLEFSFSGLKTQVATAVRAQATLDRQTRADIAAGFMAAVVETLAIKCRRALEATGREALVAGGGVTANKALRAALEAVGRGLGVKVCFPAPALCTDNGAMIAHVGALRLAAVLGRPDPALADASGFDVRPRWPLEDLAPIGA